MSGIIRGLKGVVSPIWKLVQRWPVRAQALVVATVAMGSAFGLQWDGVQVGAVSAFSAALLAFITETAVTPLSEPTLASGTAVTVTTPGATPDRTETIR